MAEHVIKNQNPEIGYYTGTGWQVDAQRAQKYPTKEVAEAVIRAFGMQATAEDTAPGQQPQTAPPAQPAQQPNSPPQQQPQAHGDTVALAYAFGLLVTELRSFFRGQ